MRAEFSAHTQKPAGKVQMQLDCVGLCSVEFVGSDFNGAFSLILTSPDLQQNKMKRIEFRCLLQ